MFCLLFCLILQPHQMTSSDKDFRFMATNDLLNELQNDSIKLDEDAERKILKALLILLRDNNAEVQNLAVKWSVSRNCFCLSSN